MDIDFTTHLSDAERERLALLLEEMGEAQQVIGKILRHGYESYDPFLPPPAGDTNRGLLMKELGDVSAAMQLMLRAGDISGAVINQRTAQKLHRVWDWLHFQPSFISKDTSDQPV